MDNYILAISPEIKNKDIIKYIISELSCDIIDTMTELKVYLIDNNRDKYVKVVCNELSSGRLSINELEFENVLNKLDNLKTIYEKVKQSIEQGYTVIAMQVEENSLEKEIIKYLDDGKSFKII